MTLFRIRSLVVLESLLLSLALGVLIVAGRSEALSQGDAATIAVGLTAVAMLLWLFLSHWGPAETRPAKLSPERRQAALAAFALSYRILVIALSVFFLLAHFGFIPLSPSRVDSAGYFFLFVITTAILPGSVLAWWPSESSTAPR